MGQGSRIDIGANPRLFYMRKDVVELGIDMQLPDNSATIVSAYVPNMDSTSNVLCRHYLGQAFEIFSKCCYQKRCLESQSRLIHTSSNVLCSPENLFPVPSKQSMT